MEDARRQAETLSAILGRPVDPGEVVLTRLAMAFLDAVETIRAVNERMGESVELIPAIRDLLDVVEAGELPKRPTIRAAILEVLAEGPATAAEVARRLGIATRQASHSLVSLRRAGKVVYDGRRWRLADDAPAAR
jgi:DNA-binding transcriptional ArsR family regulator